MKNANYSIHCDITSCKHNADGYNCELDCVDICACRPCTCNNVHNCSDSMCASFENK